MQYSYCSELDKTIPRKQGYCADLQNTHHKEVRKKQLIARSPLKAISIPSRKKQEGHETLTEIPVTTPTQLPAVLEVAVYTGGGRSTGGWVF